MHDGTLPGSTLRIRRLSAAGRAVRNLALRLLGHVPPFKRKLTMGLSGLARRRYSRLPGKTSAMGSAPARKLPAALHQLAAR